MIALITKGSKAQKLAFVYSICFVVWAILVWAFFNIRPWASKSILGDSLDLWAALLTASTYDLLEHLVGLHSSGTKALTFATPKTQIAEPMIVLSAATNSKTTLARFVLTFLFLITYLFAGSNFIDMPLGYYYLRNLALLGTFAALPKRRIFRFILSVNQEGVSTQLFMSQKFVPWGKVKSGKLKVTASGLSNSPSLHLTLRDEVGDDLVNVYASAPEPAELENLYEFFERNFEIESEAFTDVRLKT